MAAMEDVLDLYAEPYDADRPVVGFDERPLQLQGETRTPVPTAPGGVRRVDYEYRRDGTGNVFTTVEPLAGWRHVEVTQRRTTLDFCAADALVGGRGVSRRAGHSCCPG